MLSDVEYVKQSLDINLFFLRILKEHAIFLEASLPGKNVNLTQQADMLKNTFENLLVKAINISYGTTNITNDMVTEFTYEAERSTAFLTGIPINTDITLTEQSLSSGYNYSRISPIVMQNVFILNNEAIAAAQSIIDFKTYLLENVLACRLFTTNYPLLIEHIRREAKLYVNMLVKLQNRKDGDVMKDAIKEEAFWNQIMAEHAEFIRGYLDPTEEDLIKLANSFGNQFDELTQNALELLDRNSGLPKLTQESYKLTKEFKGFKAQATKGLLDCEIKSIIVPLLGDHVLREANHYLLLLKKYS